MEHLNAQHTALRGVFVCVSKGDNYMMTATATPVSTNHMPVMGMETASLARHRNSRIARATRVISNDYADPVVQMCEEIAALERQEEEIFIKMEPISQAYSGGSDEFYEPSPEAKLKVETYKKESGYAALDAQVDKLYEQSQRLRRAMHLIRAKSAEGLLLQIWDRCAKATICSFDDSLTKITEVYTSISEFVECDDRRTTLTELLKRFRSSSTKRTRNALTDSVVVLAAETKAAYAHFEKISEESSLVWDALPKEEKEQF